VTDAILVDVAKRIANAIEAQRVGAGFEIVDFETSWGFDGREKDIDIPEGPVLVRVVVPRTFDQVVMKTRTELSHVASWDIDVRQKLGIVSQDPSDQELDRDHISKLTRLVEQIHEFFHDTLSEHRFQLQDHQTKYAEWIGERDDLPEGSRVLVAYSIKHLTQRQFYGCCREVFEVTG